MRKFVFIIIFAICIPASAQTTAEQATESYFTTIKKDPKKLDFFLKTMPKGADLHNHLGGASMAENMIGYAENDQLSINRRTFAIDVHPLGYPATSLKNLRHYPALYAATIDAWSMRNFHFEKESGHDHFFATFEKYLPILVRHRGEMLNEVVQRACEQNELYLELMIMPDDNASGMLGRKIAWNPDLTQLRKNLLKRDLKNRVNDISKQLDAIENIQSLAHKNACYDFKVRYLYQVLREQPAVQVFAQLLAGFELSNQDPRVLGINLVQAEDGKIAMKDYTLHMHMIKFLHRLYPKVHISLHAGELVPGLVAASGLRFHIREAVDIAQAERIGHGIDIAYENKTVQLLKEMAKKHILVEINLSSNEAILNVLGKAHPILLYMRYKVPVTLSTDDEGVLRTNLTEQYKKAILNYHFSYAIIKMLVRNSIHYSFLPGKPLWEDDRYRRLVPVCLTSVGSPFITIQCRYFLSKNEKAHLQWALENQFLVFEKQFLKKH
jgi:adenosine deaminase